jgi:2-polyprenyl-6-methoxyphenol hydroxylase-like FAD-dependent oxidoreductase
VVTLDTAVTSVELTPTPSVHLANGTTLTADLIVCADGARSVVRDWFVT